MTPEQKALLSQLDSFDADIEKCLTQLRRAQVQFASSTKDIETRMNRLTEERQELIAKLGRSLTTT